MGCLLWEKWPCYNGIALCILGAALRLCPMRHYDGTFYINIKYVKYTSRIENAMGKSPLLLFCQPIQNASRNPKVEFGVFKRFNSVINFIFLSRYQIGGAPTDTNFKSKACSLKEMSYLCTRHDTWCSNFRITDPLWGESTGHRLIHKGELMPTLNISFMLVQTNFWVCRSCYVTVMIWP